VQQLLGADRLDPPFVGVMTNGTSGDVNNIDVVGDRKRLGPYEKMREVAELTAQAVCKAHGKVEYHDWVELAAAQESLTLAVRKPTEEQLAYFRKILDKPADAKPYHSREKIYARRVMQLDESPDEIAVPLQAFRIGELGVVAIPFEVLVEIGVEIKRKSPIEKTFTISLANGSFGYLPPVNQHALGGYETWMGTNVVEIQAAPKIVEKLLAMLERLD
jgi:hypothetical protein